MQWELIVYQTYSRYLRYQAYKVVSVIVLNITISTIINFVEKLLILPYTIYWKLNTLLEYVTLYEEYPESETRVWVHDTIILFYWSDDVHLLSSYAIL